MIATLLNLERPLIVIDLETTGLDSKSDRIVEIGFEVHKPDGQIDEWRSLVNPEIPISEHIAKIHGVTDEDLKKCRRCGKGAEDTDAHVMLGDDPHTFVPIPTFIQLAPRLAKGFTNCDFAGKNVRFDLGFLAAEFDRAKVTWSFVGAYILDADALERLAVPRHLSDLYKKYTGQEHIDAHTALADVKATTIVITKQLEHHTSLPRSLRALHELSWPGWIDSDGKFRIKNGGAVCCFGKYNGWPMRRIPVDYWKWITKSDFSVEMKKLASDALAGVFPK